jgi:hypothetical protein
MRAKREAAVGAMGARTRALVGLNGSPCLSRPD